VQGDPDHAALTAASLTWAQIFDLRSKGEAKGGISQIRLRSAIERETVINFIALSPSGER
jgi:hypothetical protein